ncbi:hypothetical protein ONS95_013192 [Cadophora gregata]|uniref:uncharacterized protein n=1 Tax=Cadophora gregata TaxID=51156 RepID=UPI0026DCA205|nr:uncharacterized protein ONS95_013192 [Cadophora gregata]KAK0099990.1 hypothetical protein ONS96_007933 [Cadophora gregata f. sp. sojae]KAK0116162.1 hypothetical protein ONS95_013192 [Cadophora gregata]
MSKPSRLQKAHLEEDLAEIELGEYRDPAPVYPNARPVATDDRLAPAPVHVTFEPVGGICPAHPAAQALRPVRRSTPHPNHARPMSWRARFYIRLRRVFCPYPKNTISDVIFQ